MTDASVVTAKDCVGFYNGPMTRRQRTATG
jgi:hypothetical protein